MEDRTVFQPVAFGSVKPGVRFNGIYEIVAFVTQGGMGEVYRGFNIQTGDPVAIKMIRPELTNNPDVLELFKREAKTLHKLAHEAIVRYFVFTVDPDTGRAYLAMEFVDGPSLTNRIESGPLPLTDVKILQTRIGSALEAAHRLGVIHRDVSPDNIILPEGDVRNAKVIDFGIARSLKRAEVTIIGGGFAGKYNYASPEQFGLAGGEVTFKSDIYSFGLVLAAALRGRPIDMSGSEVEAIAKRRVVPDLSDIDPTIRPLIQGMLQPLPADRPASMAAVAAWAPGDTGSAASPARGAARPLGPASGRAAAMLGAVIALASVEGPPMSFATRSRNGRRSWWRLQRRQGQANRRLPHRRSARRSRPSRRRRRITAAPRARRTNRRARRLRHRPRRLQGRRPRLTLPRTRKPLHRKRPIARSSTFRRQRSCSTTCRRARHSRSSIFPPQRSALPIGRSCQPSMTGVARGCSWLRMRCPRA